MTAEREERPRLVYGPVPSRRLGQSLGVDPIPFKTCNYNCVYCQLGRTRPLTHERKDYFPRETILGQVREALETHEPGEIEYVTFVGQGEPLLCASLGWLVRQVKALTEVPVAVITNGSLFSQREIREELLAADLVIPTLDAADQATFRRINRPWPRLRIDEIIEGMVRFRETFAGQLWMEVMLVEGLNDTEAVLFPLRDALARIRPDRVQINLPVRPPAEAWVRIPDEEAVMRAVTILGEAAEVVAPYEEGEFDLSGAEGLVEAILSIIRRHPMRESHLLETLGRHAPGEVQATLQALEGSGQATRRQYRGQAFWQYAAGVPAHSGEGTA
ncbi:MAG: radical SAM protein [Anaerolineae bacterium]